MQALARPLKWPPIFPLDKALKAWLPMNERSGSKAFDRSGRRHPGTLHGPSWVAGPRGGALGFDGDNDYLTIPNHADLNPVAPFSIVFWLYPIDLEDWSWIVDKYSYVGQDIGWAVTSNAAVPPQVYFVAYNQAGAAGYTLNSTLTYNAWNHVVAVLGDDVHCYVNKVDAGPNVSFVGTFAPSAGELTMMRRGASYSEGRIRGFRFLNRALSQAEVNRLYESELRLVRH